MVETPVDPSQRASAALRVYLEPALRHAGWFGFFLVLAPIIGPRGYGLFFLALSGVAIGEAVLSGTAAQVLVDLEFVEERHWSTALVTMIAAGAALSLMLYAAAREIGAMVDEAVLGDIFQSLTLLPLLGALAVVPTAMLRRAGRRVPLAAASAAGLAAGGGMAVALAWAGAGPWSLVAQIIVQRFLECAVLWGLAGEHVGIAWSRRHFVELFGALDLRALGAAWPAVSGYGLCLLIGLLLGPSATGLYLLASRLAEAVGDIFLARPAAPPTAPAPELVRRVCQVALPAVMGSALLAIALPPLLDPRWWGAVLPAQILLLGAIPGAIVALRAARAGAGEGEARWQAVQVLGAIAVAALAVPYGLVAIAAAALAWTLAVALASLGPIRQELGDERRAALAAAARPCCAAAAAGFLLLMLADPVGLALAPLPALCLLTASGWLCYLVLRGEPSAAAMATAHGA